jgi:thiamine-phosphate pyrophosphorylase
MQKYLMTSREFYGDTSSEFCSNLCKQVEKHQPNFVLYRDKGVQNYSEIAAAFVTECKKFENVNSFLHQESVLAKELGANGVHLTSSQFDSVAEAKEMDLLVIISTHTHEEVLKAQMLGADAVTYSPIFASPNKGEPKGVEDLRELLEMCEIKVFALGGIVTQEHVDVIAQTKAYGFASIRYFY